MRRKSCGGCLSADLHPVLDLGRTPLADVFPESPDVEETYYPLVVLHCVRCGLVQLADVVPDELLYGADYAFRSSTSPAIRAYHQQYADWLLRRFSDRARRLTVEIACNDGSLLSHLDNAGCRTVGIDPASGAVAAARDRGLSVVDGAFNMRAAIALREEHGPAGLIVANNVLAHIADLHDTIAGIAYLMADDGVAVVEVQYLHDLLAGNMWDHVYHEHRYFLSVESLAHVLWLHNLGVVGMTRSPMQGGSVRLTLTHGFADSITVPEPSTVDLLTGWQARVDYSAARIRDLVHDQVGTVAGYGASAKSCTLLAYCGFGHEDLDYVVDTTPAKVGRWTPGTHIPVVAPGERPEPNAYLLLTWNYLASVLRREQRFWSHGGGRFLVPIPTPMAIP